MAASNLPHPRSSWNKNVYEAKPTMTLSNNCARTGRSSLWFSCARCWSLHDVHLRRVRHSPRACLDQVGRVTTEMFHTCNLELSTLIPANASFATCTCTVSAITCATTPTASYHEISISWNWTEHLHSSEPLKLNPGQFQKHELPRGAPSVSGFCRCQSLDRHTASIIPKERHRSRQLRVFVTAVSSPCLHATARNSTLALDRSGSVLI